MFTQQDLNQIKIKGIGLPVIRKQIDHFIKGFPFVCLARAATPGDGLVTMDEELKKYFIAYFEKKLPDLKVVKFVPASGAASRMFKHLFEFREQYISGVPVDKLLSADQSFNSVSWLVENIRQTAFSQDLARCFEEAGIKMDEIIENKEFYKIIEYILVPGGLDYANLPKALLKFHQYEDGARTAAEEHLVEAAEYTRDREGKARIHFTISPEHREKFMVLFDRVRNLYESELGVEFEISFSVQKPSTDTLAVDENNQPVRNQDGTLLFLQDSHP